MTKETDRITEYCEEHSSPQPPLLYELERETYLKTLAPQMISGHLQGRLLGLLSSLLQPKVILEIGSFTGYATLCLAEGLPEEGRLHTIEANEEMGPMIRRYIEKAGLENKVQLHIGKAQDVIPKLEGQFDLVFIDAGKLDYARHYDLIIDRVNPGGLILADNVLWNGKVVFPNKDKDAQTLDAFKKKIREDDRVETIILPLRDGLTIARKKA